MQTIHSAARQTNSVRAIFEDGMSTFLLSRDATLEELAGRLGQFSEQHRGKALGFEVTLRSQSI